MSIRRQITRLMYSFFMRLIPARPHCALRTAMLATLLGLTLLAFAVAPRAHADDSASFRWKSVEGAQLRLDDKVPLTWNVYQLDKKKQSNLILVLLGRRYLLLDSKAKLVYLVLLTDLHADGPDLTTADLTNKDRLIPTTSWNTRDVGPAQQFQLTLGDYGRTLTVQLPHPLNLRLGIY